MNREVPHVRDVAVASVLTGWLTVTALSQHPNRTFDRFRAWDPSGIMIPDWRFFAPTPASYDYHVLHRHVDVAGAVSAWRTTTALARRRGRQGLWFPDRRNDKAVADLCNEIIGQFSRGHPNIAELPCYRLIREFVAEVLASEVEDARGTGAAAPAGYQFVVARSAGYDESVDPEYLFASPYETWVARATG